MYYYSNPARKDPCIEAGAAETTLRSKESACGDRKVGSRATGKSSYSITNIQNDRLLVLR